jgi:hypothetical protein
VQFCPEFLKIFKPLFYDTAADKEFFDGVSHVIEHGIRHGASQTG